MQDWLWATAADLGRGIGAGQIDPVALTQAYLDAIAAHPMRDRIYARVTADRALAEATAAAARAKSGQRRSLLDGVPISWKDNYDTAGIGTEAGTALMAGRVPDRDATVLRNATAMGLVCLGKTHMTEIAFSGLGYNPVTATPPNVNDPDAVPGGSSSGAAASVAFGLAAAGIGSDTGGSVRLPAAWNDLIGFKPTHDRLPLDGVVALAATFDTVGPLCRSVEDAALLFGALEGKNAPDLGGADLTRARLMVMDTVAMEGVRAEPQAGFDQAVARLKAAGATVEHRPFAAMIRVLDLSAVLVTADAWAYWRDRILAAPEKMFFQIRERIEFGATISAADYLSAWAELRHIRAAYLAQTAGYDAVIWPSSPILPPNVDQLITDAAYYKTENLLALRNTRIGNLMGLCGVTLPTGTPSCGILFNGAPGADARLLRLAAAAAQALA